MVARKRGPLIPKLRGQFAEFLNEGYLARLKGLPLSLPVSVCSTDTNSNVGFSWRLHLAG